MSWRAAFLKTFGPGLLAGITLRDWFRLLADNRFAVDVPHWPRVVSITFQAFQNSLFGRLDRWEMGEAVNDLEVPPPVFLLGHWRNGTTHLHNLMATDDRFAFPNTYQAVFPHTFLTTEKGNAPLVGRMLPPRRPMDNVEWNIASPQEDEFALAILCQLSPCIGWIFPKRREHYDRFLTFHEASDAEVRRWRETTLAFIRKLTWASKKPLLLKSPPHTARVRLLLEMFPDARFVHIRRNPYHVFPSSRKTFLISSVMNGLQPPRVDDLDDWVLRQYRTLYDAYFEDRSLIPPGRLHELTYEDLESDPVSTVRGVYDALDLPTFAHAEPTLRRYVESVAGYVKNTFDPLPDALRTRIASEWRRCFDEWGYAV